MKNPPVVEKLQVRYQDLDTYGHVNNAVPPIFFESARMAYYRALAERLGLGPLEAGDIPEARYVLVEVKIRYRAPIYLEDTLFCGVSMRSISNRSFTWDYELRAGESYENARTVAEGTSAQVFYDSKTEEIKPRPEWFLAAVAELEGRPEEAFSSPPEEDR